MRRFSCAFAAAFTLAGSLVVGTAAAEAQSARRTPLYIEVKPRSWLDAGNVVPVGSMSNYIYDLQGSPVGGVGNPRGWNSHSGSGMTVDYQAPAFLRQ